ncbi:MAG: hypothetical protein AUG49_09445 [Catenulispora sp. 13_1_20CM_3_70_7]|nr:MAG: hypothetical protein AUG49_09445 [Catenulispora sp. 13_1_20CM_3_70_7]
MPGTTPCRNASAILMSPATPAAACVWPRLDFNAPNRIGWSAGRSWPYVASSACASIGSPSAVPVPCASTTSTSAADRPALASACWINRCCAGPLGAVSRLLAPSWFTAEPRSTARTRWPNRCASDRRSTTTTTAPSDQPEPSAAAENGLHRPSGAATRCCDSCTKADELTITVAPPTSASEHSP